MTSSVPEGVTIAVSDSIKVSGLLQHPKNPKSVLVLAHGAGAGMHDPYMAGLANELQRLDVATLRYQFPYMEHNGKRPDPPALCHATVRAAVAAASRLLPPLPLFAGGRSFGGRMTSQAQAAAPLPGVRGIIFFGFPLHPPKQPSAARGEHLLKLAIPLLFLQGTRDALADSALLHTLVTRLGRTATVAWLQDADHSFHVPVRTGRTDAQVQTDVLTALVKWMSDRA